MPPGSGLEREPIAHDAAVAQELRDKILEIRSRSGLRVICVVPLTIFAGSPMESTSTT